MSHIEIAYGYPPSLVKPGRVAVDTREMTRALGLIAALAVVAAGGYLYAQSANEAVGPTGGSAAQDAAASAAADATLAVARTGVEAFAAANGSYAGAPVPTGVTLVAVDVTSYCLQVGTGEVARHLSGPGPAQPGPC